jgi:nucleotide-binding universal stress UspA family protein
VPDTAAGGVPAQPGFRAIGKDTADGSNAEERAVMFKKILFPTDFSEVADKALAFIRRLKSDETRQIVLLNVVNQRLFDAMDTHSAIIFHDGRYKDDPDAVKQRIVDERREKLAAVGQDLEQRGFAVKMLVNIGNPRKEILKVEAQEAVSAIVMGSHGRSNLGEMLIGSVTEKVVRRSSSNVIVIKR